MQDPEGPDAGACAPVSEADVEDEVTRAEARADAARAHLSRLRGAAEAVDQDNQDGQDEEAAVHDVEQRPAESTRVQRRLPRRPGRPRWLAPPRRKTIAVGVGAVVACASIGASGYMLWQHRTEVHKRQLAAELTAAARQGVTALMSIDPDHAKRDVQRMIDASTGDLNSQLSAMSVLMVKKAEESKVGSKVSVEGVAVESSDDDSGVVLVAAKTDATGPDDAKPPSALFRLSVTMNRDGGQLKMSKVDYLQ